MDKPDESFAGHVYALLSKRFATQSMYVPIIEQKSKRMLGFVSFDKQVTVGFSDIDITAMRALAAQLSILLTLGNW